MSRCGGVVKATGEKEKAKKGLITFTLCFLPFAFDAGREHAAECRRSGAVAGADAAEGSGRSAGGARRARPGAAPAWPGRGQHAAVPGVRHAATPGLPDDLAQRPLAPG